METKSWIFVGVFILLIIGALLEDKICRKHYDDVKHGRKKGRYVSDRYESNMKVK